MDRIALPARVAARAVTVGFTTRITRDANSTPQEASRERRDDRASPDRPRLHQHDRARLTTNPKGHPMRIARIVAAAALAALAVAPTPRADAVTYTTRTDCTDGFVCMDVTIAKDSATHGIYVADVVMSCTATGPKSPAFGWGSPAVDGHALNVYDNTSTTYVWSRGEGTDLYVLGDSCHNSYTVNVDRPNSHSIHVWWTFTERLRLQADKTRTLSVTIQNY